MFGGKGSISSMRSNAKFAKMLRPQQLMAQPAQDIHEDANTTNTVEVGRFGYLETPLSCICTHTSAGLGGTIEISIEKFKQKKIPRRSDIIMDVASSSAMGKAQVDSEGHTSGQANKPLSSPAHALPCETVALEIGANTQDGLTAAEAKCRLEEFGRNELDKGPGVQPVKILIRQIANAMMLVKLL
ncbi:MAG: hypothetical protein Q9167_007414 [Letrouitia subvulpina]